MTARNIRTVGNKVATKPNTEGRWVLPVAVIDRIEQVVVVLMWSFLAWRVELSNNPYAPLALISETTIAIFTLIRRPTEKLSMRIDDWLLAMTATYTSLLVVPGQVLNSALVPLALTMMTGGNLFQIWAKLTLRRSFGVAPANRGVKVTGPYRFVRHPMYAGYLIVHLSILMLMFMPFNVLIYAIGWWAQALRMGAEERLLSQDPVYAQYKKEVRWRLLPGVY